MKVTVECRSNKVAVHEASRALEREPGEVTPPESAGATGVVAKPLFTCHSHEPQANADV